MHRESLKKPASHTLHLPQFCFPLFFYFCFRKRLLLLWTHISLYCCEDHKLGHRQPFETNITRPNIRKRDRTTQCSLFDFGLVAHLQTIVRFLQGHAVMDETSSGATNVTAITVQSTAGAMPTPGHTSAGTTSNNHSTVTAAAPPSSPASSTSAGDVSPQQSSVTSGEFQTPETTPATSELSVAGSAGPDPPTTAATTTAKGGCDSLSWSCSRLLLLVISVLLFEAQSV